MMDSLVNVVTGMGTERDKSLATMFRFAEMDQSQLDDAYRGDWIARKIVDIPADDATREWRAWQADASDITAIEAAERKLSVQKKVKQAMLRGRLYGGGALVLGVAQGDSSEELRIDRVRKGDLRWIHVASRYELSAGPIDWRVDSPYYGQPEYYARSVIGDTSLKIHPSRVIRFLGNEVLDARLSQGWGDSVLQVVADAVLAAGTVTNVTAQLVQEAKTDVVKIPEMSERIRNSDYEDRLRKRFALANLMRSAYSILLIDKEEEWERLQSSFAGMPDLLRMYMLIASGAAEIPAVRMLGQSPTGLSATGESDIRNHYDRISDEQRNEIQPTIAPLDEILLRSALGARPEDIFYEWNSLWQSTEKEKMEIEQAKAAVFKIDVDSGLLDPVVLREARENQLIESGLYPGLEGIIEEFGAEEMPTEPPESPEGGGGSGGDSGPAIADAAPRPLYVRRDVLNADEIWAHYAGQIRSMIDPAQAHVTVIYTLNPVDWMLAEPEPWQEDDEGRLTVKAGGPRVHDFFGPDPESRALVLMFNSSALSYRHVRLREELGAQVSYPDYQAHVTLAYSGNDGLDPRALDPWTGPIVLGPEIFEVADPSWRARVGDDFNEADHPRHPSGTSEGGQFAPKEGGGSSASTQKILSETDEILKKENKGNSAERVQMRKALKKETDPAKKKALQQKILDSMKMEYDATKKPALLDKMDQYSAKYKLPHPVQKDPGVVSAAEKWGVAAPKKTASELGKYTPEETRTFDLLSRFSSESDAKIWMSAAKEKMPAGEKLGLNFEEMAYAQTYTGSGYREINSQLRSGSLTEAGAEYSSKMNSVLDKLPARPGTTYRRADMDFGDAIKYKPGNVVVESAFTSSSKSEEYLSGKKYGFVIHGKSGKDISTISKYPHEQEILFRKGTAFKVLSRETPKDGGGTTVIHLEEYEF